MEKHKKPYSDNFRKRYWEGIRNGCKLSEKGKGRKLSEKDKDDSLRTLLKVSEQSIIDCYAGFDLDVDRKKVVEIIQVDAFFIIELFMRNCEVEYHDKDYILSSPWLRKAIELELILIENQLPFSLLQDIYIKMSQAFSSSLRQEQAQAHKDETVIDIDEKGNEFLELTCKFFEDFGWVIKDAVPEPKHFTDLVRHFMLPHVEEKVTWEATTKNRYSITMLTAARVNFMRAGDEDDKRLVIKIDDPQASDECVTEKKPSKHKLNLACFQSMNLKLTLFRVKDDTECII
ncbi:hypothetical protein RchiOBHm_Chr1g0346801 [Rosa chinensis]|uniref:Uncharacterized protein n=1 Tax=Rosa chinensis TaxID=74649 RepID=A0A2P6SF42_ROSCH|nr:hypothetical protein RchiOBHm_Chr1g0346801 [Rosa chinensis]